MKRTLLNSRILTSTLAVLVVSWSMVALSADFPFPADLTRPAPVTMEELGKMKTEGVSVVEVSDYVYGNYQGSLAQSPPHADGNPRKAFVVFWKDFPFRFIFSHEGSYCPWFELPSGAGVCYQFWEAPATYELFHDWGRKERNSFVDVIESGPERVWIRWTYFAVNITVGDVRLRGIEDFWIYPNGLVLRRQTYEPLTGGSEYGEPIEIIGMSPAGKTPWDVLQRSPESKESHALAILDAFSSKRYDVFWKPKPNSPSDKVVHEATPRRTGSLQELEDSPGVAYVVPMTDGAPFCILGDASGFRSDFTKILDHSYKDTGSWVGTAHSWNHWPIGWKNSYVSTQTNEALPLYPSHFAPAGMRIRGLPFPEDRGMFYSLIGVGDSHNMEAIRTVARKWLQKGAEAINPAAIADLPAPAAPTKKPASKNK